MSVRWDVDVVLAMVLAMVDEHNERDRKKKNNSIERL